MAPRKFWCCARRSPAKSGEPFGVAAGLIWASHTRCSARLSSQGWLLFTDADVRFAPDALRKAVALAMEKQLEHLTLLCELEMRGFWED
jgi:hypothetical protein